MQHNFYQLPLILAAFCTIDVIYQIASIARNSFVSTNILSLVLLSFNCVFSIFMILSFVLLAVQYSPEKQNAAILLSCPLYATIGKAVVEVLYFATYGFLGFGIARGVAFLALTGLLYMSAKIGKEKTHVYCAKDVQFKLYKQEVKEFREHVQDMIRRLKDSKAKRRQTA